MISLVTNKKDFISGTVRGEKFNIPYCEVAYAELTSLKNQSEKAGTMGEFGVICDTFKEVITSSSANKDEDFDKENLITRCGKTGKLHLKFGKMFTALYFPRKLEDLMISNKEEGIDNAPYVSMLLAFMRNPLPTQKRFKMLANYITAKYVDMENVAKLMEDGFSETVAKERSTYMDLQLTKEGFLKTSKVADEVLEKWALQRDKDGKVILGTDGKPSRIKVNRYDKSTVIDEETGEITESTSWPTFLEELLFTPAIYKNGDKFTSNDKLGYVFKVGEKTALPEWSMVSMVDGNKHQKGLHVGGLAYVNTYLRNKRQLLECFVCPSMIGKFTDEGIGEMTCKEMFIYDCTTLDQTTKGMFHSSNYQENRRVRFKADLAKLAEESVAASDIVAGSQTESEAMMNLLFKEDVG